MKAAFGFRALFFFAMRSPLKTLTGVEGEYHENRRADQVLREENALFSL
jgi:hypothetical protein